MIVSTEKAVKIVEHYGELHQMYKAVEELSELQTVIVQEANENGKIPVGKIIEEIADVYVMLAQLEKAPVSMVVRPSGSSTRRRLRHSWKAP